MAQAIKFRNWTDRDFTWSYDSTPYSFKAGEELYLEDFKAQHFAKHLTDRELNKMGIPTNNVLKQQELERKCFVSPEPISVEKAVDIEAKKKEVKPKVEEEFADLKPVKVKVKKAKKIK